MLKLLYCSYNAENMTHTRKGFSVEAYAGYMIPKNRIRNSSTLYILDEFYQFSLVKILKVK